MGKIRRGSVFARSKRKMRRLLRRLEGRKGPGMDLLD
jgi:hypothetical protein